MAAVLAGGAGAVLSYASAAMNWRLLNPTSSLPHVTTATKGRRRRGIRNHTAHLPADEVTIRNAIPTTTVARTLLDLAATMDAFALERALARAEFHGYPLSPSLPTLIARYPRRHGLASLRAVLATGHHQLGITESPLEDRFLRFLDSRRLERPELQVPLDLGDRRIRVDGMWRELRLVVELDGRAAHERQLAFESDRRRDRRLLALGWRPIRITDEQLGEEPDELEADLLALGLRREGSHRGPADTLRE